tara:strand:+ start:524 stop:1522 length:999 start_codon:yes stop_codon:yes gene_type:complete
MYNAENYISNCIDSLLNQDLVEDEYEIIVIDDGSTDNSFQIMNNYVETNKNIFLFTQDNIGLYPTRNKLLKLAKGDYIYNIDADDYIVHDSLSRLLKIAFNNSLDILGFESLNTSRLDLVNSQSESKFGNFEVCSGIDFLSNTKFHNITVWWYIVKREFIISSNISFEKSNPLEDGPFTLKLFYLAKKVVVLNDDVHRYVKVPTSIMNSDDSIHLEKMVDSYLDVTNSYNSIINEVSKKNDPELFRVIKKIKYFRDVNVYFLFFRFLKGSISIKKINPILDELKKIKAYPISYFIEARLYKSIVYIFNHRFLFYSILYPIRFLYKFKLIKLP